MRRVYISLPLAGPTGKAGREVLRGAELALEAAGTRVIPVVLDSSGEDREAQAVSNARRAVEDDHALAYLGDFHSSQILETAPILGGSRASSFGISTSSRRIGRCDSSTSSVSRTGTRPTTAQATSIMRQ
jgi:ABC-type branched-subunit amino acid transport system substrate-binding protein